MPSPDDIAAHLRSPQRLRRLRRGAATVRASRTSRWRSTPARSWRSSAPAGAARARCCAPWSACSAHQRRGPRPRQAAGRHPPRHLHRLPELRPVPVAHRPARTSRSPSTAWASTPPTGRERVARCIDMVGLEGFEEAYPKELSRRHEAARRHRPRAGPRPGTALHGRAVQRPGRLHRREPAERGLPPLDRADRKAADGQLPLDVRQEHPDDHAHHRGGGLPRRPHRGHGHPAGPHPPDHPEHAPAPARLPVARRSCGWCSGCTT